MTKLITTLWILSEEKYLDFEKTKRGYNPNKLWISKDDLYKFLKHYSSGDTQCFKEFIDEFEKWNNGSI